MTPQSTQTGKRTADVLSEPIEYTIKPPQHKIPRIGNNGTNGTLNGLGFSGSVFLKIKIATHTIINDANVPKLQSSADMFKSINKAPRITIKPESQVTTCGVLYLG